MKTNVKKLSLDEISLSVEVVLNRYGLSQEHIEWVKSCLITASLWGIDTHGVTLLKVYENELKNGVSNPRPIIKETSTRHAVLNLDADDALGIVSGTYATNTAISIAKEYGISAVMVKNSNHFGCAGFYSSLAAQQNMIGISFSNADALVTPFNGVERLLGTNPIGFSIRGSGDDLFLFDMATSQVSYSAVKRMIDLGEKVSSGLAVDKNGHDLVEGGEFYALKGLGGYKGQGLGMMVQILTAVLSGSPFDADLTHLFNAEIYEPRRISHLFICIDVTSFGNPIKIKDAISKLLNMFRNSRAGKISKVIVPGDKELEKKMYRQANGIPVSEIDFKYFSDILY